MPGDKNRGAEWNETIQLIPFEKDGDGYLLEGMDKFLQAVFSKEPEERVGFALGVMKDLCSKKEYRKVVKLCDFVTAQLIDVNIDTISSGLSADVLEFFDLRANALCRLETSLLKEAEDAITSSDVGTVENLCGQIVYTRHKKLWAYSDQISRQENVGARLGRAKTYLDLGNLEEAKKDILVAKSAHRQRQVSAKALK